jgi:peptidoglycan/xylan/chitin deacetylase (PgdA/CDA1 family)
MDIIILCHTEFGFVYNKRIIYDKNASIGVTQGVINLIKVANKYGAKITFAIMPETVKYFPVDIKHEMGLHIHPGWVKTNVIDGFSWYVGDSYLKENCKMSVNSTILSNYTYNEQLEMIRIGKECLQDAFGTEPKSFVAGRWSINNDTVKALIKSGITHECSAMAHSKKCHYDWSKLPRLCMPYHPKDNDYQKKGNLPLLIVPISQMLAIKPVNPEFIPLVGLPWFKACFIEYYKQDLPLFHICLHSPCMTNDYFISAMDNILRFISKHNNINYKFASEIEEYLEINPKTKILPYLLKINKNVIKTELKSITSKVRRYKN